MTIVNSTRNTLLARFAYRARTPWGRLIGLMGRRGLAEDSALVLSGTRGVHTHFMRFPIDVVFYDAKGTVIDVAHRLGPWRFSRHYWRAAGAIELPPGVAEASGTRPGDSLTFAES